MQFVISRKALVDGVNWTGMILGHHIENAARAKVYASIGNKFMARWYGRQARNELASYLERMSRQP